MSFWGDERAQAIQIGAVLLFAVLVISFSLYQAFVVPNQNAGIELNHNSEVQSQLQELRNAIHGIAGGNPGSGVTVNLGTTYPTRVVALNPPPPSGRLYTDGTRNPSVNFTIVNATADGETGDLWNGSARPYNTGGIMYAPDYNEYRSPPTTIYENSLVYNQFESQTLSLTDQSLISGDRISIVTLNGSFDRSGSRSMTVDPEPISTSDRTISVADGTGPITLNITTRLSVDRWQTLLNDEDNVLTADIRTAPDTDSVPDPFRRVLIPLNRSETYTLGMTKVGVGSGVSEESGEYLTLVDRPSRSIRNGSSHFITLEVRDRFNNPVSGFPVNAMVSGGGQFESGGTSASTITNPAGQAVFNYTAPAGEQSPTLQFNITEGTPQAYEEVSFGLETYLTGEGESGNATASVDATYGGLSDFASQYDGATNSAEELFTQANGKWTNVNQTGSLNLSAAEPILQESTGHDRLDIAFTLRGGSTPQYNYSLAVTAEIAADGSINSRSVSLRNTTGTTNSQSSGSLSDSAVRKLLDGGSVNLLDSGSYLSSPSWLSEIQRLETASPITWLTNRMEGRVNVTWQNAPPVADAGSPSDIEEGSSQTLDASASSDPDLDTPFTYSWTVISGPGSISGTGPTPTYNAPADVGSDQSVTIEVTVTDADGDSSTDQATFTVEDVPDNISPTAEAGTYADIDEGGSISLDGSSSSDADGTISTYDWAVATGPGSISDSDSSTPGATYNAPSDVTSDQSVTVELTVTDNESATDTDTATFTVRDNAEPAANAGGPYTVNESDSVTLDGTASSDDTGITSYSWAITDNASAGSLSNSNTASPEFIATSTSGGTIVTVELTVTDDAGQTDTDTATITINDPPVANFTYSPSSPGPGEQISFDGSSSSDSDGNISTYEWDWTGDGTTDDTGQTATHTYDSSGTYDVTLRVTDNDGAQNTTTRTISVTQANILQNVEAEAQTSGNSGKASFVLSNNGSATVTVSGILFNSSNSSTYVEANNQNTPEIEDDKASTPSPILNVPGQMNFNQQYSFNNSVPIDPGESIQFNIDRFRNDGNMQSATLTFTIYLNDGSQETYDITFSN
ncbi:PKD domain containing protein [Halorhabdus utahensis DSM 12940]|uniref:PKD domain containing protein n=2 Tax=Halorhabdus utahensis TaxID=146826 RepID=C7NR12_HALUD|nr:PKD domain containing protein [Halorhabdus utahensis DSM 12940]